MSYERGHCPFCGHGEVMLCNRLAYMIYDTHPVNRGHALVVVNRHEADYFALSSEEKAAVWALVDSTRMMLDDKFRPSGYNVGINVGEHAGQTVWHAHVHLIPRYVGDVARPRGGVRAVIPSRQLYGEEAAGAPLRGDSAAD